MPKYVFKVEQEIEVTADSYEKAVEELPVYPTTHGQVWEMLDETIGLLYKREGASV